MNREKLNLHHVDINSNKMESERDAIRAMSDDGTRDFSQKLFDAKESEIIAHPAHANIIGLAIDPETIEYYITDDGQQKLAKQCLTYQVRALEEKREGKMMDLEQEYDIERRIISGFIISGVEGFSSPIFVTNTFDFDEDRFKNLVDFLKQQDFIAVTEYGDLIE